MNLESNDLCWWFNCLGFREELFFRSLRRTVSLLFTSNCITLYCSWNFLPYCKIRKEKPFFSSVHTEKPGTASTDLFPAVSLNELSLQKQVYTNFWKTRYVISAILHGWKAKIAIWFSQILPLIMLTACCTTECNNSAVWDWTFHFDLYLILSMSCVFAIRKSVVRVLICLHFWYIVTLAYIYVIFFWRFDWM